MLQAAKVGAASAVAPACSSGLRPVLAFRQARQPGNAAQPDPCRRRRHAAAAAGSGQGFGGAAGQQAASKEDEVTKAYNGWAEQAGIVSPKVSQAYFGELRGAKALQPIAADEVFVTVPRGAALVVAPNEKCPCPDFVEPGFYKDAPWFVKMGVLLLRERGRGRASPVWGYVEQLPSSIDTPVRWAPAELEELQYEAAVKEIQQQQGAWRQQYDQFCAAARAAQGGGGGNKYSYEDFLWGLENVRSRAFSGPYTGSSVGEKLRTLGLLLGLGGGYAVWQHLPLEQALNGFISVLVFNIIYDLLLSKKLKWYALCPIVDSINHSSLVQSDVAYEYFQDQFVLSTKSSYQPGQQVFISYGAQTNGSLLQYYGFTEPGNPNDVYAWRAALGAAPLQLTVNAKGSFTAECQAAARAALGGSGVDDAALRAALLAAAEAELGGKPTSIADDERLLQTPHLMSPRQRMAVEFRLEKKRLLERAIAKGKKRLAKQQKA